MTEKEIPISLNPGKLLCRNRRRLYLIALSPYRILAVQETCFEQYYEPSNNHTDVHVWFQYHSFPISPLRQPSHSVLL